MNMQILKWVPPPQLMEDEGMTMDLKDLRLSDVRLLSSTHTPHLSPPLSLPLLPLCHPLCFSLSHSISNPGPSTLHLRQRLSLYSPSRAHTHTHTHIHSLSSSPMRTVSYTHSHAQVGLTGESGLSFAHSPSLSLSHAQHSRSHSFSLTQVGLMGESGLSFPQPLSLSHTQLCHIYSLTHSRLHDENRMTSDRTLIASTGGPDGRERPVLPAVSRALSHTQNSLSHSRSHSFAYTGRPDG